MTLLVIMLTLNNRLLRSYERVFVMPGIPNEWIEKIGHYDIEIPADKQDNFVGLLGGRQSAARDALYRVDIEKHDALGNSKRDLGLEDIPGSKSARTKFFQELATINNTRPFVGGKPVITMEDFLGPGIFKLYQAAILEEANSPEFREAVFLQSIDHYEGETLDKPLDVVMGGASSTGKTFVKESAFLAAAKNFPKKTNPDGFVAMEGNFVVSVDGAVPREMSQVSGLLLQVALSKGYKGIEDLHDSKLDIKKNIQAAALASTQNLNLYIPETFADNHEVIPKKSKGIKNIEDIQENHPNRNLCVGMIKADEAAVRFSGENRAWLTTVFKPEDIKINNRDIGCESKKYGTTKPAFIGKLFAGASFWFGNKGSQNALKKFQSEGVPTFIITNDRILVRFNEQGKLMPCKPKDKGAHLENERIVKAWNAQNLNNIENNFENFKEAHPELSKPIINDPLQSNKNLNSSLNQERLGADQLQELITCATNVKIPFEYSSTTVLLQNVVPTIQSLEIIIKQTEKQILDSKAKTVIIDNKRIRVFDGEAPFKINPKDFYARGLQHASAMLKIADLENSPINEANIKKYLLKYTEDMSKITGNRLLDFKKANKYTSEFIGMMSWELAQARGQNKEGYEQAFKDIKKATELYSMIEPSEDAVCTVMSTGSGCELQLSEKLTFAEPVKTLEEIKQSDWYIQGKKKYGAWFEEFMANDDNRKKVLMSSPPCTTRDMPNPSNAWKESSIFLNAHNAVTHREYNTRFAISSPFDIKSKSARVKMATDSMKTLLNTQELERLAQEYIARWDQEPFGLKPDQPITIPILHQTLVAPTFFYGPDRNMMAVKKEANKQVAAYLAGLNMTVNGHPVKFELGQVNNCINMWHPMIIPTNNDINDSNKLVARSAELLDNLAQGAGNEQAVVQPTIDYLNGPNRSWLPIGFTKKSPPCPDVSDELKLMIQAAINLKKLNHETHFGWALRRVKNAIRIKEIPILAPLVFIAMSPIHILRYISNTGRRAFGRLAHGAPRRWVDVFVPTRNKQTAKSVYESILASQLGMVAGGCKSALDRAGEVNVHKQAMLREFAQTGQLFEADSSDREYYKYLDQYVNPVENSDHQKAVAANGDGGVGARKLWEARTDFYVSASDEQNGIMKQAAKLRKVSMPPTGEAQQAMVQDYENYVGLPDLQEAVDPLVSPVAELSNTPRISMSPGAPVPVLSSNLPARLEVIQKALETNHRTVHISEHDSKLTVSMNIPATPPSNNHRYYIVADPDKEVLDYSAPVNNTGTIDSKILELLCEDAVLLAEKGAVFDLSNTDQTMQPVVEAALRKAIGEPPKKDITITYDGLSAKLDVTPRLSSSSSHF